MPVIQYTDLEAQCILTNEMVPHFIQGWFNVISGQSFRSNQISQSTQETKSTKSEEKDISHEFHETSHSVTLIVLVNSHQR